MVALPRTKGYCVAALCLSIFWNNAVGAESNSSPARLETASTAQWLSSFRLKPGFRLQLVASEPMVKAPVAIAFDENGRLFVVERQDSGGDQDLHLGRVRVLEDPDTNGLYQRSSIYVDNLPWASAVACYAGGVFVAATPNLYYFKDTKNDGAADVKQVVLTGFGTNQPSAEALPNSFIWGLDDRIHGVTAGIGGLIVASNWPAGPVSLAGSDFSLEPRTLEVRPEAGPSQSGLTFDSHGRRYVSDYSQPLRKQMYEVRYTVRNPFYPKPAALTSVLSPATRVFHFVAYPGPSTISDFGLNTPPIREGTNALVMAWLGSARGCAIYSGGAFPANYIDTVFLADPDLHVVHHALLREKGLQIVAERPPDELNREFLASADPAFRPVQIVNGPEGALYIVDAQDGNERGRIYRVIPNSFKSSTPAQLGKAKTYELVRALAEGDGWRRTTAARLLFERRDRAAVPLLTDMVNRSRLPQARLWALHSLDALGALRETHLLKALLDSDPTVREHGVLLTERFATNGIVPDTLWSQLSSLAADPAAGVRYQLAFTLGDIERPERTAILARILTRDMADPWMRNAVLSSLGEKAGRMFTLLAGDARFRNDSAGLAFLRQIAIMIGTQGHAEDVAQTINFILRDQTSAVQAFALLAGLGEGLHRTQSSLALVDPQGKLQRWYTAAFNAALDSTTADSVKVEALRLLGFSTYKFSEIGDLLLLFCLPLPSVELQSAAIDVLGRFDDPLALQGLLNRWPVLTLAARNHALTILLSNQRHVRRVVDAIATGQIPVGDLSYWQLNFLRTCPDASISTRAVQLLGSIPMRRPEAEAQFQPALRLGGSADRGRATFRGRCAQCHQVEGEGQPFGPDLTAARLGGKQKILNAVLEPNLNIAAEYATCIVETKGGENLIGIKREDGSSTITLRQPGGTQLVWPRFNTRNTQTPNWSLMPGNLAQGLSTQDMADLLEYIVSRPK